MYKSDSNSVFIGKNIVYLPSCQSTNDELATLVQNSVVPEGTIVITDNQTAGRGQRGSQWHSQAGQNLTFSLYLQPIFLKSSEVFNLNMAVALGVLEGLTSPPTPSPVRRGGFTILPSPDRRGVGGEVKLKWPNDIYFQTQKLGGILIENSLKGQTVSSSIVGIGLNVNQLDFDLPQATSLRKINGEVWNLEKLLNQLAKCIERKYTFLKNGQMAELRRQYLQNLLAYQENTRFEDVNGIFEGVIMGVADDGKLAIKVQNHLRYYGLKEVKMLLE